MISKQELKNFYVSVARNIKAQRLKKGLSQTKLAKLVEKTDRYIQRLEQNPKNISLGTLAMIAHGLETPMKDFFDEPSVLPLTTKELESLEIAINVLQSYLSIVKDQSSSNKTL